MAVLAMAGKYLIGGSFPLRNRARGVAKPGK
jgi:hypothetical protein